jgi:hypothetical protein
VTIVITHSMEEDSFNTEVPLIANDLLFVMEYCMLKFCEALQFLVESLVLSATLAQGYPVGEPAGTVPVGNGHVGGVGRGDGAASLQ